MTYLEATTYVGATRLFGMKLGLETMQRLAEALGNPQDRLRFIHLAGTNGKGSTAAFCDSCLRAGGQRVGIYTSPHLVSIRERIQIDRVAITEEMFAEGMGAVRAAVAACPGVEPSYFEIMTALALWYFEREKVTWVVWETGLGGRLDATNIVQPEVCIITNIGLDHTQYLGTTLGEIASEKAGIIKTGVPVVSGLPAGEAADVIRRRAELKHAPLFLAEEDTVMRNRGIRGRRQMALLDGKEFELGLLGSYQITNATCAVTALRHVQLEPPLTLEHIAQGLASTRWMGRFQLVSETPLIVLDGAHNFGAMQKLLETWMAFLFSMGRGDVPTHLVFGSVSDKNISAVAELLLPHFEQVSLVHLKNERSATTMDLAQYFGQAESKVFDSVSALWRSVLGMSPTQSVLITGSLFLVGEVLAEISGGAGEFGLNERLEALSPPPHDLI